MALERWAAQITRQREMLQIEEDVVLDLLEEVHEIELEPGNGRDLFGERSTLKRHLVALAGERARLGQESRSLDDPHSPRTVEDRYCVLLEQFARAEHLLRQWRQENARGRRRRLRDHVWLDALLLERARLQAERRRLDEQRTGGSDVSV